MFLNKVHPIENKTQIMKKYTAIWMLSFLLMACGNAEVADDNNGQGAYFPVVSYLKGQASQIDSSLYTLIHITKRDNNSDTTYIKREDFKNVSKPFLNLPNIATGKLKNKYTESRLYDETLDRFIITYTPKDVQETLEILRQDVVIIPNTGEGENIESVYIERQLQDADSTVQMKMSWETAKGFTIRSIIQKKNSAEVLQTTEVLWADPRSAAKL